jgi:hypothetical protein
MPMQLLVLVWFKLWFQLVGRTALTKLMLALVHALTRLDIRRNWAESDGPRSASVNDDR